MAVKAYSQNARVLDALKDGRWHSVAAIHRHAGTMRLNSRVSELRTKHGFKIEHRVLAGKDRAALRHQYRLIDPPALLPAAGKPPLDVEPKTVLMPSTRTILDRDAIPRTDEHRYRIYRLYYDNLELVTTAPSPAAVGEKIIALGKKGEFAQSCIGILDTFGQDQLTGSWIVSPWDTEPLP